MNNTYEIALKINKRYYFAEFVKKLIALEKNDNQKKLLLQYLLHYNCTHIMGRYSDFWIEKEIIELGRKYVDFNRTKKIEKGSVLFVMTKVGAIGGHTALVNNWMQFDKERSYSIVLTDCSYNEVPDFLKESVKQSGGTITILHGNNEYKKAEALLQYAQCFEKVVLFIHMYDIIPILAFSNKNWKTPVYFYNHANFLFSVGVSISDAFLTLGAYDSVKAKKFRGASNVHILTYPSKNIEENTELTKIKKEVVRNRIISKYKLVNLKYLIVSMGDDFKYKYIPGCDYKKFVIELLKKAPEGTYFLIIGADSNSSRWKEMTDVTKGHAVALGRLDRCLASEIIYSSDAYVASFPMEAAGLEQAWSYNVPVFRYSVTNRGFHVYNEKINYLDITVLIHDIISTLNDRNNYKIVDIKSDVHRSQKKEWLEDLNKIFKQKLIHKCKRFKDKKVITKEEIINCQLLNDVNMYPFNKFDLLNYRYKIILNIIEKILGEENGR